MKKKYMVLMSCLIMFSINAQDSVTYQTSQWIAYKNLDSGNYKVENNKGVIIFKNLKFVKQIMGEGLQALDENNKLFYIDENGLATNKLVFRMGFCGTVPHYTLKIEEKNKEFVVWKDETFYDSGNKIPAEIIFTIPKSEADEVLFLNQEKEFFYDANYGILMPRIIPPETLIIKKGNYYQVWGSKNNERFDSFNFTNGRLKLTHNQQTGYYSHTKIKYKEIGTFEHFLATIVLPNGKKGYVDLDGNEYF